MLGPRPPQNRTKRWPSEVPMEGWFPRECGEQIRLEIAEAVEGRTKREDRSRRALPDEPSERLAPPCIQARHR